MQFLKQRARVRGLDGVRALAVIAVVAYHLWPSALPGGFVGVDVFFVLSGYLITRSFTKRAGEPIGRRLRRFWQHRARRILPPLLPVIAVTATAAGLVGGNVLPGLWSAVVGALTFSSNWVAIVQASSYFAGTSAHPLQHLWSLAVEEQFYLIWPLLLLLIGLAAEPLRKWFPISIGVVSAVAMAVLFVPGADPTFVYVGTGTHVFGLAAGAALALHAPARSPRARDCGTVAPPTFRRRISTVVVGAAALVLLVLAAVTLHDDSALTYRGGLIIVSVATAALVWSLTRDVPGLGRLLDVAPLRALGRRSYALYLWHWPVLVLLTAAISPENAAAKITVRIGTILLSLLAAAASWRWIEYPILTTGWRAAIRQLRHVPRISRAVIVAAVGVLVIGTGTASLASTRPSDAEQFITAGQQYLHDHSATPAPTAPTASSAPTSVPTPSPTTPPTAAPSATPMSAAPSTPTPTAAAPDVHTTAITAVGDSVMLAAAPALVSTFPNVSINAVVSRQPYDVAPILAADAASGRLADTVLIGIGTNGALGRSLPAIRRAIGPARTLVLITAHGDRAWIPSVNATITAYAPTTPHTVVADWNTAITGHDDLLASDGIHPGAAGARIYAQVVVRALQRAQAAQ